MDALEVVYRCPGEAHAIDRGMHLARLASFYPACLRCCHREDTGALTALQRRQLSAATSVAERLGTLDRQVLLSSEGGRGAYANQIDAAYVRRFAGALGVSLREQLADRPQDIDVVLGFDGRDLTSELVAAASEALRMVGCRVIQLEPCTAPCAATTVHASGAHGGMFLGNPTGRPHHVGLRAWRADGVCMSLPGSLSSIERALDARFSRPVRSMAGLSRSSGRANYLPALEPLFHALRPLRFVLDTTCVPLVDYLRELLASGACQLIRIEQSAGAPAASSPEPEHGAVELPWAANLCALVASMRPAKAHFGLSVDGDGENCQFVDERGRRVEPARLAALFVQHGCGAAGGSAIAVGADLSAAAAKRFKVGRRRVAIVDGPRECLADAMLSERAAWGVDGAGGFWFGQPFPRPDALTALCHVLSISSQSDRAFSELLDGV